MYTGDLCGANIWYLSRNKYACQKRCGGGVIIQKPAPRYTTNLSTSIAVSCGDMVRGLPMDAQRRVSGHHCRVSAMPPVKSKGANALIMSLQTTHQLLGFHPQTNGRTASNVHARFGRLRTCCACRWMPS